MSLRSHHVSVSGLQLKTGAIVNPPRSWTTSTTSATIWVEEVWKTWCEKGWGWMMKRLKICENAIYYYLFTFWILWSTTLCTMLQCTCVLGGGTQFWPRSNSHPQAVAPGRKPFGLIADFRIYARCLSDDEAAQLGLGMFFGFFRWCLWGHTWCMGVGPRLGQLWRGWQIMKYQ